MKLNKLSIPTKGQYGIGASSSEFNPSYPSYLRITDIDDFGRVSFPLATSINPNNYPNYNHYFLSENDIVFARTGASAGRNYFHQGRYDNIVYAGFLIKFHLNNPMIIPKYVGYYCQSKHYWNQVNTLFNGSTRSNINAEQLGELDIPIYNLDLQQHIVDTIHHLRFSLTFPLLSFLILLILQTILAIQERSF